MCEVQKKYLFEKKVDTVYECSLTLHPEPTISKKPKCGACSRVPSRSKTNEFVGVSCPGNPMSVILSSTSGAMGPHIYPCPEMHAVLNTAKTLSAFLRGVINWCIPFDFSPPLFLTHPHLTYTFLSKPFIESIMMKSSSGTPKYVSSLI